MKHVALIGLLTAASALPFFGTLQSIATTGHLKCGGKPAETVKVKLYEEEIFVDDLLDMKYTDSNGFFEMSGKKKEFTSIDPIVNIYHKCNYNGVCFKKISVKVPKSYVTDGGTPTKVFDLGDFNIAGPFYGGIKESIDCFR